MRFATNIPLARRTFLRGAGVTLALPFLDAMRPAFGADASKATPRRMVCIETNMGILPQFFFPEKAGKDYVASPYLERLKAHRNQMTVLSGVSLPGVTGGHAAERCFLTGTPHPERGGFRNWISLDQFAAEEIGNRTRYPSLVLAVTNENATLSYTRSGAPIPSEKSPKKLFERLFIQGKPSEITANVEALQQGRSLLDFVGDQSKRLNRSLSAADQARMDQYYTSVRELEKRLHSSEEWEYKPKPVVTAKAPEDIDDAKEFVAKTRLMFEVMKLALETDSTRLISLFIDTTVIHNITHHGNRPEVLGELRGHEEKQFDVLNGFLTALAVHYGIKGVSGPAIRRVKLPPGSPRGGFLTQAAILKITANGTTTSPVPRGAFVLARLLGQEPEPPPANVAAVEPDVRGTTTIREQLAKHRDNTSCNACHAKMDPPGFALESFDVIGGERERYRSIGDGDPATRGSLDPRIGISFKLGPKVDASGELADGRKFANVAEFQTLLATSPRPLLLNLAQQLTIYSTGRPLAFSDRAALNELVARTEKQGGGIRTLIHELTQSQLFQTR